MVEFSEEDFKEGKGSRVEKRSNKLKAHSIVLVFVYSASQDTKSFVGFSFYF